MLWLILPQPWQPRWWILYSTFTTWRFSWMFTGKYRGMLKTKIIALGAKNRAFILENLFILYTPVKPWPNASLDERTCIDRLAMGGQLDLQVDASESDASCTKAFQCRLAPVPVPRKTLLRPNVINLHCVAKWWITCIWLHPNLSLVKLSGGYCKPL